MASGEKATKEIFNSSVDFDKKSEYDLITIDVKTFQTNGKTFKVSQIITMNIDKILERKYGLINELNQFKEVTNSDFVILMITDILSNGSYILYNENALTYSILQRMNDGIFCINQSSVYIKNNLLITHRIVPPFPSV